MGANTCKPLAPAARSTAPTPNRKTDNGSQRQSHFVHDDLRFCCIFIAQWYVCHVQHICISGECFDPFQTVCAQRYRECFCRKLPRDNLPNHGQENQTAPNAENHDITIGERKQRSTASCIIKHQTTKMSHLITHTFIIIVEQMLHDPNRQNNRACTFHIDGSPAIQKKNTSY